MHGWRPLELEVIPDEGKQSGVGDVKGVNWGGSFFFSGSSWERF